LETWKFVDGRPVFISILHLHLITTLRTKAFALDLKFPVR